MLGLKTHFQNIHNSVHTEDQTIHECEFCSAVLKTKENLRTHVKNVHEHSETQCGICFKRLNTNSLPSHLKQLKSLKNSIHISDLIKKFKQ